IVARVLLCVIGFGVPSIFLTLTEFSDPGILPKAQFLPNDHPLLQVPQDYIEEGLNEEEARNVIGNRFCKYCNIYQPVGTFHCKECDSCIMGFDHYCEVVGNAVGLRNHGYFVWFLLSSAASAFMFVITAVIILIIAAVNEESFGQFAKNNLLLFVLIGLLALVGLFCLIFG
ncbi:MAG: hypothetical protein EZS28_052888, partial [Streblomastix strix]